MLIETAIVLAIEKKNRETLSSCASEKDYTARNCLLPANIHQHRLGHRPRRHAPHAVAQIGQRVLRRGLGAAARLRIAAQHERDRHDDAEADEHGHALVDLGGAFGLRGGFVGEATGAAATSFLLRCERGDKA